MNPIRPEPIKNILAENILYTPSSGRLTFDLSWTPPLTYGELQDYELIVLNNQLASGTTVDITDLQLYFRQTFNVSTE